MKKRKPTNIAVLVRERLLAKSRESQKPFAELLQYAILRELKTRITEVATSLSSKQC